MAKTKKEIKVKEPVRIREKVLDGGTISLYLDMYYKGSRKKGGLKLMGKGWAVSIVQHKTGSPVTVPLNEVAHSSLPPRLENDDQNVVFRLPKESDRGTKYVRRIRDKAGIAGKELTYHCCRHTAATLAISAGAELYSVSKILGHRNLVSTQVYAKVNLEKKMEAVNLTKGVFK